ncbi:uncharacterized protein NDAI_0B05300 [Naumovozyma dairenensis CBS 421]|uniref:ER transporter 6TM N-terminal domain-containing protein n=1 Tax=Naumovozyma dairenensis (strain ATCC 10597 / BCRC 20456 / CBS 421 / NBRC 0211 / NRRL Y-12639) TaxID=1071378 RepID=G0W702_NAUDC|nr:hypothetical protein NDAI_0B05300 [Naumovozyma dairenensis CBS 421]CCD23563.1 hypothetical protein NDAI_0B05300 [Naumovozyma dairenensis CBS 421]
MTTNNNNNNTSKSSTSKNTDKSGSTNDSEGTQEKLKYMLVYLYNRFQYYFPCDRILTQRIIKATVNTTIAFIFCLIPKVRAQLGTEPAMLPLISVIVQPGRRVGATFKAAINCTTGLIFGLAYAIFGRVLAHQCMGDSWNKLTEVEQYSMNFTRYRSALGILAMLETFMLFFHGWMRSVNHLNFAIVFPLFLVVHFGFMASLTESAGVIANTFSTPFYLGIAMSLFWTLTLFPEFGSSYLGNAAVDTFNELHRAIDDSVSFFISLENSIYTKPPTTLSKLLKAKTTIEKKVNDCGLVLKECIYEISYSYVPPTELKPILENFQKLTIHINGLVNAGQLEFILLGKHQNDMGNADTIHKEITFANAQKLSEILENLKIPIYELHRSMSQNLYIMKLLIAYDYDVDFKKVNKSTAFPDFVQYERKEDFPKNINLQENYDSLKDAMKLFDLSFKEYMKKFDTLAPNDEIFLLSSFLMNFKQTVNSLLSMMESVNEIHQFRLEKENKGWLRGKTIWFTFLTNFSSIKQWLFGSLNGITENEGLNANLYTNDNEMVARRPSNEEEEVLESQKQNINQTRRSTVGLPIVNPNRRIPTKANNNTTTNINSNKNNDEDTFLRKNYTIIDLFMWIDHSCHRYKAHFRFGFQVAIALMMASFPMFIPKTRHWYIDYRGPWIGFVCILCVETSVGETFWVFFLRAVGCILGAAWGYLSYVAGIHQTNPYLETVITVFGAVPGFYFLIGSPYLKAAIIYIISIYIVMIASIIPSSVPGGILVNFAKRCLAVGYGGGIALIVQVFFFPVKARDELNAEIAFTCKCIAEMELLYASGLEGEPLTTCMTDEKLKQSSKVSSSAKAALNRATVYNGMTRQEPRLKGEFTELENIFTQVIFLQKQIIERMDNVAVLRNLYGSAIIEELNDIVYPYRRHFVASMVCLMRAIQEAFVNKTPLPQFLPSAKITHRRMINKVRMVIKNRYRTELLALNNEKSKRKDESKEDSDYSDSDDISPMNSVEGLTLRTKGYNEAIKMTTQEHLLEEKFLSWNASSSATEEIVEYMEELLRLTKLLVGVNEFKYGFLSRPLYEDWAAEAVTGFDAFINVTSSNKKSSLSPSPFGDVTSTISEEEDGSLTSSASSNRSEGVIPYQPHLNNTTRINLARIASNKVGDKQKSLPKDFRDRSFSIGSIMTTGGSEVLSGLSRKKTLGEANPSYYNDEDESSDEEDLPLALKMIFSRKSKAYQNDNR